MTDPEMLQTGPQTGLQTGSQTGLQAWLLPTEADTAALGRVLAGLARAGDCILLDGPIGAGKSTLARAFIRARMGWEEEVPSPSFTLVQVYEAGGVEIWHADLYRLTHPDEVGELGLDEAFGQAIALVEWPDRLGSQVPPTALVLRLEPDGEGRRAVIRGGRAGLREALARAWGARQFLAGAGWAGAERRHLAGDASDRRYERLWRGAQTAVLMDNPPGGVDDPAAFVAMARHLRGLGLSAPQVLAADVGAGFLLLEDLGDGLFSRILAEDPAQETRFYAAAVDVLCHLQAAPAPPGLTDLTAEDWAGAAALALDVYAPAATGHQPEPSRFTTALTTALATALRAHADGPRVLILRDFHAGNLLWLGGRAGLARVGLLDFQLGQMGQRGYDLVSLLQDARRDVAPATEAAMIARFAATTGEQGFAAHYATLGAQRALRILGVFARLGLAAGKPGYLRLIPRVWGQLQRNLAHPALADLRAICDACLPAPSPDTLRRIARRCPTLPSR